MRAGENSDFAKMFPGDFRRASGRTRQTDTTSSKVAAGRHCRNCLIGTLSKRGALKRTMPGAVGG
jgi:hypothetical protein